MEEYDVLFKNSYGKLYRVVFYAADINDSIQGFYGTLLEYTGTHFIFLLEDGSVNVIQGSSIHHMIRRGNSDRPNNTDI